MNVLESLVLAPDRRLPIYLQIQHQLRYLITSGQLPPRSRLPTVREIAARLDVNGSTVALVYRNLRAEGLIDAAPGRGTFVSMRADGDTSLAERERLAIAAVERALLRNAALGFTSEFLLQRVSFALQRRSHPRTVVLIGGTRMVALKYAASIERRFPNTAVVPFAVASVENQDPVLEAALSLAYDVVVFSSLNRAAREAIRAVAQQHRLHTISGQVTEETVERLGAIGPEQSVCLLAQTGYLNLSIRMLEQHLVHHDVSKMLIATEDEGELAARLVAEHDVVIFNTGVLAAMPELRVPWQKAFEIVFDLDVESLSKLRAAWSSDWDDQRATPP
jgi:DNA-binding transcriptional regulator YhcF (GntR family)